MEGRTISHFRVDGKIGGGGMGVVYRAEDLKLGRPVALKFLPPEAVSDPERRQRFLREARTEAALSHPGIASVFEVDEADGSVFIAMEFVEGKTLRSFIGGHPLPVPEALKIGCEMAEALSFAHDSRVIHRDLKPDNVMVRPDGHVKILDFGLAKFLKEPLQPSLSEVSQAATASAELTQLTQEMKIMGTAAYMAPEQARGEKADPRADIFAFGVILYEMLTERSRRRPSRRSSPWWRAAWRRTGNAGTNPWRS
jgi:serine/threonine protein kinase